MPAWYDPKSLTRGLVNQVANDPMRQAQSYIGAGQRAGFFDPNGSPLLTAQRRRTAIQAARARRRRGANAASLYGLDPSQTRAGLFQLDRQNSGDVADALNQGQYQEGIGNRDYIRQLFGGQLDYARQRDLAKYQADLARQNQGSFWGDLAGKAFNVGADYLTGGGWEGVKAGYKARRGGP